MDKLPQEQQEALQALYDFTANELITKERKSWEVRNQLIDDGVNEDVAKKIIDTVKKNYNSEISSKANKNMAIGGLFCVGGLAITIFTLVASSGGGSYIVAWGAIIFGGIQFFQGYNLSQKKLY